MGGAAQGPCVDPQRQVADGSCLGAERGEDGRRQAIGTATQKRAIDAAAGIGKLYPRMQVRHSAIETRRALHLKRGFPALPRFNLAA